MGEAKLSVPLKEPLWQKSEFWNPILTRGVKTGQLGPF